MFRIRARQPSIKVIITPHSGKSEANPYAEMLLNALTTAGAIAGLGQSRWLFPLWRDVSEHGWPDIIHLQRLHGTFCKSRMIWSVFSTAQFFLQWIVLRALGVRFVWTVHNILNHERYQEKWELMASRLLARLVDRLVVHCESAISLVAEAYDVSPKKLAVTPLGNYASWYPLAPQKSEARRRLGLPEQAIVFLFFGLIREYKGVEQLLADFPKLGDENLWLILLGRPQSACLATSLEALTAGQKNLLSRLEFIPDEELVAYIAASDLVVLPYKDVLTSSAIMMAASFERPVLAPRIACMQEWPEKAAILYDPQLSDGLAEALRHSRHAPLSEMGRAAKAYADECPWSLTAEKTISIYYEVKS